MNDFNHTLNRTEITVYIQCAQLLSIVCLRVCLITASKHVVCLFTRVYSVCARI